MEAVTYEQLISDVAKGVEGVGAAIMVLGGLLSLGKYTLSMLQPGDPRERYRRLRRQLGQAILLGLEVLIVGDIVRTIIVDPTVKSVGVLGMIVAIRIVLSFSLEVEIDGVWPWNLWRLEGRQGGENGDHPPERLS
jgi:uncharacterized membrane protein